MDTFYNAGVAFVAWIQSLGAWLVGPMQFFSFFGSETFFLLLLPVMYWCVDVGFALQLGAIMLFSSAINGTLKLVFHAPRPYWFSTKVTAYAGEPTFGIPSGHSQNAVVLFGTAAVLLKRRWFWLLAIFFIIMIGFSRMYLGVHFPQDVLTGWAIGALILWGMANWWKPVKTWAISKSLVQQIWLAFALSVILLLCGAAAYAPLIGWNMPAEWMTNALQAGMGTPPMPVTMDNTITSAAALFGLLAGVAWIQSRGGYDPRGSLGQKALRLLPGVLGLLIFYFGLGLIFPKDATLIAFALRYLRYALVGAWVSAGAPWLFQKLKLAG